MTDSLFDEVPHGDDIDPRFRQRATFPPVFGTRVAAWSMAGPVAYVEAEFFSGGSQFAVVWHHGDVVRGPLLLAEDEPAPARGRSPPPMALHRLGAFAVDHSLFQPDLAGQRPLTGAGDR